MEAATEHPAFARALGAFQAGDAGEAEKLFKLVLADRPQHVAALNLLAVLLMRLARFADAEIYLRRAIDADAKSAATLNNYAIVLTALGRPAEALESLSRALQISPRDAELWNKRGIALMDLKRYQEAVQDFDRATECDNRYAEAFCNKGKSLALLNLLQDAYTAFDRSLAIDPNFVDAHYCCGNVCSLLKRHDEAIAAFDRALTLKADWAEAWLGRGNACSEINRREEAVSAFDKALALNPDFAAAHNNRATVLLDLKRFDEALAGFDRALQLEPDLADAWVGLGSVYYWLSEFHKAAPAYERAIQLNPRLGKAWFGRGNVLAKFNRYNEALEAFETGLALDPDFAQAWNSRAEALARLKRFDEAITACDRALALKPELASAAGTRLDLKLLACDWRNLQAEIAQLVDMTNRQHTSNGVLASDAGGRINVIRTIEPMIMARLTDDAAVLLTCATDWVRTGASYPVPFTHARRARSDKIRLGYLSQDFRQHVTGRGFVELFEMHDASRFELHGISLSPDDGSTVRKRIAEAFNQFHDVSGLGDEAAAKLIRDLDLDLIVEMVPHSHGSRPAILAHRPVPVQVNGWSAGYSSGASYLDYILSDPLMLPLSDQAFFSEKIVHLPHTCFPYDSKQAIGRRLPERAEEGLPEQGFVFCSFNASYKITPKFFAVWMRLLHAVEGSVLWLARNNDFVVANLRRAAGEAGIDAERLVFAEVRPAIEDHLARHQLADLVLDTLPYNAQTTAMDALWAGVPVLTCAGHSLAGRFAMSQLRGIGVPELIADDLAGYERLAIALAHDPEHLAQIRAKIRANRTATPLFDTKRLCRELESAYATMVDIWRRGEAPRSFSVEPV
jgi:protein O-GlcNAc transferase